MSKIKNALDEILNCELCNGLGYEGFANGEDFDVEWCECNPNHLSVEEFAGADICVGCNENIVSWDALYCLNCYVAKNAEIDYDEISTLWTTAEAK